MALLNKSKLRRRHPISIAISDFHGDRHPQIGHPIQCRRTDPRLSFLLRQGACFHRATENALVPLHRKFNMAAQVVAGFARPSDAPFFCDHFDMLITLGVPSLRTYGSLVRWNDNLGIGLMG